MLLNATLWHDWHDVYNFTWHWSILGTSLWPTALLVGRFVRTGSTSRPMWKTRELQVLFPILKLASCIISSFSFLPVYVSWLGWGFDLYSVFSLALNHLFCLLMMSSQHHVWAGLLKWYFALCPNLVLKERTLATLQVLLLTQFRWNLCRDVWYCRMILYDTVYVTWPM